MISDPKPTPVAQKTLTPSQLNYVGFSFAHTIRVRVPRALKTLTLTLANIIEPAGCKGLLGYGGWFRTRNHFEFFFIK